MKILYIGHYKENSGWSQAAIDYISALDQNGFDVVCRNIKLTSVDVNIPERLLELEDKPLKNIDVCIQHLLPHHMIATNKFKKNIGIFVSESDSIRNSTWITYLQNMSEVWVPNTDNKIRLINDGIVNTKVVPYAFDLSKYQQENKKINLYSANSTFKFYYIGDLNDRKNIVSILKCFHSEFSNGEPVSLIIKLRKFGVDQKTLHDVFVDFSTNLKKQLRIHKNIDHYPTEIVITADTGSEVIQSLHNTCDCYMGISHGEGWSIPAFEAMCYGNTPICGDEGGPKDFIDNQSVDTGTLVSGQQSICCHSDPAFSDIFTGTEHWFEPNEVETKKAMRFYYENRNNIDRTKGIKRAEKFSYKNIAQHIKDILDE